jgi:hypothetical protein
MMMAGEITVRIADKRILVLLGVWLRGVLSGSMAESSPCGDSTG